LKGCAVPGAVEVLGGVEKLRDPRDPEEKPPPMRASAADIVASVGMASAIITAST
jgi:hypothetical protein